MEGRKGEPSRELQVYDLEQRRLIDAEITRRTVDFMKRSTDAGKPFYAYVPYTLVHFPTLPNPAFAGRTGYGDFPDALAEMDANVGTILDAVDALGIRDDTIVVFTSDNGPEATWPWQGSSGPWRGYYFTHMEGSLRAPFIVRWPGRIPAGRVSNEIVHEVDTLHDLRGDGRGGAADGPPHRRRRPDRLPARQVRDLQPGWFPGVRGRPS